MQWPETAEAPFNGGPNSHRSPFLHYVHVSEERDEKFLFFSECPFKPGKTMRVFLPTPGFCFQKREPLRFFPNGHAFQRFSSPIWSLTLCYFIFPLANSAKENERIDKHLCFSIANCISIWAFCDKNTGTSNLKIKANTFEDTKIKTYINDRWRF